MSLISAKGGEIYYATIIAIFAVFRIISSEAKLNLPADYQEFDGSISYLCDLPQRPSHGDFILDFDARNQGEQPYIITAEIVEPGVTIRIHCQLGYRPTRTGIGKATCLSKGNWSNNVTRRCEKNPNFVLVTNSRARTTESTTPTTTERSYYRPTAVTIPPTICPLPATNGNYFSNRKGTWRFLTGDAIRPGVLVELRCDSGYEVANGSASSICLHSGSFKPTLGTCIRGATAVTITEETTAPTSAKASSTTTATSTTTTSVKASTSLTTSAAILTTTSIVPRTTTTTKLSPSTTPFTTSKVTTASTQGTTTTKPATTLPTTLQTLLTLPTTKQAPPWVIIVSNIMTTPNMTTVVTTEEWRMPTTTAAKATTPITSRRLDTTAVTRPSSTTTIEQQFNVTISPVEQVVDYCLLPKRSLNNGLFYNAMADDSSLIGDPVKARIHEGVYVELRCPVGYEAVIPKNGDNGIDGSISVCLGNLTWSNDFGYCQPAKSDTAGQHCQALPDIDYGYIVQGQSQAGSLRKVACKPGFKLIGARRIRCCTVSKRWTDPGYCYNGLIDKYWLDKLQHRSKRSITCPGEDNWVAGGTQPVGANVNRYLLLFLAVGLYHVMP